MSGDVAVAMGLVAPGPILETLNRKPTKRSIRWKAYSPTLGCWCFVWADNPADADRIAAGAPTVRRADEGD